MSSNDPHPDLFNTPQDSQPTIPNDPLSASSPPAFWLPGHVLLDRFRVEYLIAQGGIGAVYLVRQLSDNQPFAVKMIPESGMRNILKRCSLIHELRLWMDLPSHPHLSACRFFRSIDGNIAIFAEYVDGGSLKDWICQNRITSFSMLLDLAIQISRGIQAAHDCGLIHQDIKPANVLITRDGIAKVTDFGLSRAIYDTIPSVSPGADETTSPGEVPTSGMTVAYCSPEQASGLKVSLKTDIWSFGLTLLEMVMGKLAWNFGAVADTVFHNITSTVDVADRRHMLDRLEPLLTECFRRNPAERWESMNAIETQLIGIYESETGSQYSRPQSPTSRPVFQSADMFNRQTITLGTWDDPMIWMARACQIAGIPPDPNLPVNPAAAVSSTSRALNDLQIYERALDIFQDAVTSGGRDFEPDLAMLKFSKANLHHAAQDPSGAIAELTGAIRILSNQPDLPHNHELKLKLAHIHNAKGVILHRICQFDESRKAYHAALSIAEALVTSGYYSAAQSGIHRLILNMATLETACANHREAIELYDRVIALYSSLDTGHDRIKSRYEISVLFSNKAASLSELMRYTDSIAAHRKAVALAESIFAENPLPEYQIRLAQALINLLIPLTMSDADEEAVHAGQRSIVILKSLCYEKGHSECLPLLSMSLSNTAFVLIKIKRTNDAQDMLQDALGISENLVFQRGQAEHLRSVAMIRNSLTMLHMQENNLDLAEQNAQAMRSLLSDPSNRSMIPDVDSLLSLAFNILGKIKESRSCFDEALNYFQSALDIRRELVEKQHHSEGRPDLAISYLSIARVLALKGDVTIARQHIEIALPMLTEEFEKSGRSDLIDPLESARKLDLQLRSSQHSV